MYYFVEKQGSGKFQVVSEGYYAPGKVEKVALVRGVSESEANLRANAFQADVEKVKQKLNLPDIQTDDFVALYNFYYINREFSNFSFEVIVTSSDYFSHKVDAFYALTMDYSSEELINRLITLDLRDVDRGIHTLADYYLEQENWYLMPSGAYIYSEI